MFPPVIDLQTAINRFIAAHNTTEAKPFARRANPDAITVARNRGFQVLASPRETPATIRLKLSDGGCEPNL